MLDVGCGAGRLAAEWRRRGWTVDGVDFGALRPASKLAARVTRNLSAELLAYQLSAIAHRR